MDIVCIGLDNKYNDYFEFNRRYLLKQVNVIISKRIF